MARGFQAAHAGSGKRQSIHSKGTASKHPSPPTPILAPACPPGWTLLCHTRPLPAQTRRHEGGLHCPLCMPLRATGSAAQRRAARVPCQATACRHAARRPPRKGAGPQAAAGRCCLHCRSPRYCCCCCCLWGWWRRCWCCAPPSCRAAPQPGPMSAAGAWAALDKNPCRRGVAAGAAAQTAGEPTTGPNCHPCGCMRRAAARVQRCWRATAAIRAPEAVATRQQSRWHAPAVERAWAGHALRRSTRGREHTISRRHAMGGAHNERQAQLQLVQQG